MLPSAVLTSVIVLTTVFCLTKLLIDSFHVFTYTDSGSIHVHFTKKEISWFYLRMILLCIPICVVNCLKKYSAFCSTCLFSVYVLFFLNRFTFLANGFIHALNKALTAIFEAQGETPGIYYLTNYPVTDVKTETFTFCYAAAFLICFLLAFSAIKFSFPILFTCCVAFSSALTLIFRTLTDERAFAVAVLCCIVVYIMNIQGYRNAWSGQLIQGYGKSVKIHGSYVSYSAFQQAAAALICIVTVAVFSSVFIDYSSYKMSPRTKMFGQNIMNGLEDFYNGIIFGEKESNTLSGGDLKNNGNIKYKGETMFEIKYDEIPEHPSYLRTFTASVYSGNKWTDFDKSVYESYSDMWDTFASDGFSANMIQGDLLGKYPSFDDDMRTVSIRHDKLSKKSILTETRLSSGSPILDRARLDYDVYPAFSFFGNTGGEYEQIFADIDRSDLVRIAGTVYDQPEDFYSMLHDCEFYLTGRAAFNGGIDSIGVSSDENIYNYYNDEQLYRQFVTENYLDCPDNITDYVPSGFASMESDFINEYYDYSMTDYGVYTSSYYNYAIGEIQRYLTEHASYTLTPGTLPKDRDFTEYFLNESQQGYCVHFATAGVLMLRYVGIPARYAEGFYVGNSDLNPAYNSEDGFSPIRDSSAHAWAEVYFPLVGWQPVEFTPGYDNRNEPEETDTDSEEESDSDEKTQSSDAETESDSETDTHEKHASSSESISDYDTDSHSDSENTDSADNTYSSDEDVTDSDEQGGGIFGRKDDDEGGFKLFYLILVGIGYVLYYTLKLVLWLVLRWLCMKLREKRFTEENTRIGVRAIYRHSLFLLRVARIKPLPDESDEDFARRAMQKIDSTYTSEYLEFTEHVLHSRFGREPVSRETVDTMIAFVNKLTQKLYDDSGKIMKFVMKYVLFLI